MTNRRRFLGASMGLIPALGGRATLGVPVPPDLAEYESILFDPRHIPRLGAPRSYADVREGRHPLTSKITVFVKNPGAPRFRADVREGRHPFSPDRIVVLEGGRGLPSGPYARLAAHYWQCGQLGDVTAAQFAAIVRIAERLSDHYRCPSRLFTWASVIARRECHTANDASTAWLREVADELRERGGDRPADPSFVATHRVGATGLIWGRWWWASRLPLTNPPVDWWLFLVPDGVNWGAGEPRPARALLTFVAPTVLLVDDGFDGPYGLIARVAEHVDDREWRRLAALGPAGAARALNAVVARCLMSSPY